MCRANDAPSTATAGTCSNWSSPPWGISRGEFRDALLQHLARLCIAPLLIIMLRRTTFGQFDVKPYDYRGLIDTHIDTLLQGLAIKGEAKKGRRRTAMSAFIRDAWASLVAWDGQSFRLRSRRTTRPHWLHSVTSRLPPASYVIPWGA